MNRRDTDGGRTYRDVAQALAKRVTEGRIGPGQFLPRERDVQEEFGVARTTVRRALKLLVELGHAEAVPNRGVRARIATSRATGCRIAFIDGNTGVLGRLYTELSHRFTGRGDHLVHIDSQRLGLEAAVAYAREKRFDGAFVWSFEGFPDPEFLRKASAEFPIVLLDHGIPGFETDLVGFDDLRIGQEATESLFAGGASRVGVAGMLDMLDVTHRRFSGYLKGVFAKHGTPSAADFLFTYTSGPQPEDHRTLARRLRDEDRPDGLLVLQDEFLMGVVRTVLDAGLRIPEDLRLVAIGDDFTVELGGEPVPAVRLDWDDFAAQAFELMRDRLDGHAGPSRRRTAAHVFPPSPLRSSPLPGDVILTRSSKSRPHAT